MNVNLSQLQETVDRETWHAAVHGVAHNLVTEQLALVFLATVSLAPNEMYFPQIPGLGEVVQCQDAWSHAPLPRCHYRAWWTQGQLSHEGVCFLAELWWSLGMWFLLPLAVTVFTQPLHATSGLTFLLPAVASLNSRLTAP